MICENYFIIYLLFGSGLSISLNYLLSQHYKNLVLGIYIQLFRCVEIHLPSPSTAQSKCSSCTLYIALAPHTSLCANTPFLSIGTPSTSSFPSHPFSPTSTKKSDQESYVELTHTELSWGAPLPCSLCTLPHGGPSLVSLTTLYQRHYSLFAPPGWDAQPFTD